ncbi:MAG: class I SAM-dependent methyltransferase [Gemmatimonadota bacterium]|nr:class I SAM-dependent methyltransferase [Gemmatimonadota bacterium]
MDEDIFDFDGNYGERYEVLARRVIPGYPTLFPMFTALIEPELPRRGRVLVVGAGTGIEIVHLKRARPDLRVYGVDPSEHMLELAERRVAEAGLSEGVTLQLGYAGDVPTTPRFHAATLINVLHFVPDDGGKAELLADIARRLRPGGVFVFFDLHGGDTPEEHDRYLSAWRRYWKIRDMSPAEMRDFNDRIREGIHFTPAARSIELARAAGFVEPERFYRSLLYGGWTFRRNGGGE